MKIQYILQKFLCIANWYLMNDFWIQKKFLFRPFLIIFQIWWIKKMPRAKKNVNIKNSFYMPVNHAKEYLIFADTGVVFLQLLARASNSCRASYLILRIDVYKWNLEDYIIHLFYENLGHFLIFNKWNCTNKHCFLY